MTETIGLCKTKLMVGDIIVEFETLDLPSVSNAQIAINMFKELKEISKDEEIEPTGSPDTAPNVDIAGQKEFENLLNTIEHPAYKICSNPECLGHKQKIKINPDDAECALCGGDDFYSGE